MARDIGGLFYKIFGDTSQLDKSLTKSDKGVKGLGKSLVGVGKIIKGALFAGAIGFAVRKIAQLGGAVINAASNAEETGNKFKVVFRDISADAEAAAKNLADNFGLSSTAAKTLLSDTGDLLSGFGFTQESALDLSTQVNELAVDLASFTNFSGGAEGASEALTKALLGERESVKALGISILDADVKARVLEQSQEGLTFETERQAKAFATLSIAQEQSKNAIGDFERSSASFANQQRIAAAATDDLKVALGQSLLPIATDATFVYAELTQQIADFLGAINDVRRLERTDDSALTLDERAKKYTFLNAKIEDNLDVERENLEFRKQQATASEQSIKDIEDTITALEQQRTINTDILRGIEFEKVALAAKTEEERKSAEASQKEAEAAAERLRIQQEYIAFVEDEFKGTEAAKIEQLKEEIDLLENNIDSFGGLREEQQLLIDLKKEELELLQAGETAEAEAAAFDERLALARGFAQMRNSIEMEEAEESRRIQEEQAAFEAETLILRQQAFAGFFGSVSSLITAFGVNSKEQAIAIKAFSAAEAAINSYLAFTQVLADPSFIGRPIARGISAAAALTAGLAQQVKILATPIPAFADGGIVPGSSFSGDNVLARVNSGEEVLTRDDPRHALNNGGGQTINVMLDRKVLVRAVVDGVNAGQGGVLDARVVK